MRYTPKIPEKGDVIICENGHLIGRVRCDVVKGAVMDPSIMEWAEGHQPFGYMLCGICDAPFEHSGYILAANLTALDS